MRQVVEQAGEAVDADVGAVDDFGTGWSSLAYLSRLPVDPLKIDRSFVAGIIEAGPQSRLAGAIVALAQSLQLDTVAEGVETPEQARRAASHPAVPAARVPV